MAKSTELIHSPISVKPQGGGGGGQANPGEFDILSRVKPESNSLPLEVNVCIIPAPRITVSVCQIIRPKKIPFPGVSLFSQYPRNSPLPRCCGRLYSKIISHTAKSNGTVGQILNCMGKVFLDICWQINHFLLRSLC